MRVLIANLQLDNRAGTELYTHDLAIGLFNRGLQPTVYSPRLGKVADLIRRQTIPVTDDLGSIGHLPEIIHANHAPQLAACLARFPNVPAVFTCHSWIGDHSKPPESRRILRYVAVDKTCMDRLLFESGVPESKVRLLLNFVDVNRFARSGRILPEKPRKALIFSNYATEERQITPIRKACEKLDITLDVIGLLEGKSSSVPEQILGNYDLVFGKAKAAIEAMACGAGVVLCDFAGLGSFVTTKNFDRLRELNFGIRTLRRPLESSLIEEEIKLYDAAEAAAVSTKLRGEAGQEPVFDKWVSLYREVVSEFQHLPPISLQDEMISLSRFIERQSSRADESDALRMHCHQLSERCLTLEGIIANQAESLNKMTTALNKRLSEVVQ